jgi:hypothetical protein
MHYLTLCHFRPSYLLMRKEYHRLNWSQRDYKGFEGSITRLLEYS